MSVFFSDVLTRIQKQFGHKNDAETARFFGISPQVLNGWKNRNAPDYNLIFEKCSTMDLHWLLTGTPAPSSNRKDPELQLQKHEVQRDLLALMMNKVLLLQTKVDDKLKEEIETIKRASELIDRL
jgi:hypothetical protein